MLHQAVGRDHAAYHAQVPDAPAEFGDSFVDNLHGKQANTPQARVVFHEGVVQPVVVRPRIRDGPVFEEDAPIEEAARGIEDGPVGPGAVHEVRPFLRVSGLESPGRRFGDSPARRMELIALRQDVEHRAHLVERRFQIPDDRGDVLDHVAISVDIAGHSAPPPL